MRARVAFPMFFLLLLLSSAAAGRALAVPPGWVSEELEIGHGLRARVVRPPAPRGAPPRRLPAALVFGGFEKAAEVLDLLAPSGPVVLASFDYPYRGARRFEFPGTLLEGPALKRTIPETIRGIRALASALRARPDVDAERVALIGASFATPFVLAAAAEEPAIRSIAIVHGFGDFGATVRHRLEQVWGRGLGALARPLAWAAAWVVAAYLDVPDPSASAARLHASQRALLIEAQDDELIPRESRRKLWEALQASEADVRLQQAPGGHLMPGSEARITMILKDISAWLGWD